MRNANDGCRWLQQPNTAPVQIPAAWTGQAYVARIRNSLAANTNLYTACHFLTKIYCLPKLPDQTSSSHIAKLFPAARYPLIAGDVLGGKEWRVTKTHAENDDVSRAEQECTTPRIYTWWSIHTFNRYDKLTHKSNDRGHGLQTNIDSCL